MGDRHDGRARGAQSQKPLNYVGESAYRVIHFNGTDFCAFHFKVRFCHIGLTIADIKVFA